MQNFRATCQRKFVNETFKNSQSGHTLQMSMWTNWFIDRNVVLEGQFDVNTFIKIENKYELTTMSNIEEWMVYSTICWYSACLISLPVTMTVITQSKPLNRTSNVTSRQKNLRTGLKKIIRQFWGRDSRRRKRYLFSAVTFNKKLVII